MPARPPRSLRSSDAAAVLADLKRHGSKRYRADMRTRYGIAGPTVDRGFGVPVSKLHTLARRLRTKDPAANHALALALWDVGGGVHDARMLASLIDEPPLVTPAQMDRWCRGFDNWGIVDTVCFKLFDQVPPALAFRKADQWSRSKQEFVKRAGVVLLACLALHRKDIADPEFGARLPMLEHAATDERNFVKKGVSWALRSIGRRSPTLRAAVRTVAKRLAESNSLSARWVGKDAAK